MQREPCRYIKDFEKCPNKDSIIRDPLIAGQNCRKFQKHIYCPFYMEHEKGKHDQPLNKFGIIKGGN